MCGTFWVILPEMMPDKSGGTEEGPDQFLPLGPSGTLTGAHILFSAGGDSHPPTPVGSLQLEAWALGPW